MYRGRREGSDSPSSTRSLQAEFRDGLLLLERLASNPDLKLHAELSSMIHMQTSSFLVVYQEAVSTLRAGPKIGECYTNIPVP